MLLQKLLEGCLSFGTPTPEVWTVVGEGGGAGGGGGGGGGGLQGVDRSCSSLVLLFHCGDKNPPVFTLISLLFEAVILPFCIPYTFMSAVWCALEI